jgi:Tc toxin complex TcA C-terminal TcB-binding domain
MNSKEQKSHSLTYTADAFMLAEQVAMGMSGLMALIPDGYVGPMPLVHAIGGQKLKAAISAVGTVAGIGGSLSRSASSRATTLGSFQRRSDDWHNQADQGAERLKELSRQIVSAEIRIQTAEKDLEVFDQQIENSKEIYDYMRSKFSSEQLYGWMIGQLKTFHRGAYQLAAGMVRQAQMAYKRELGNGTDMPADVLTADHWDSGRAGLLAGEKLSLQLKQLDDAYARARAKLTIFELSRTVSLRRLDSVQLFALKAGKAAQVSLPAWLFQTSHAGAKLKDMRLKAVSISLPCTVGPNTRIPLRVRLLTLPANSPAQRTIITSTAMADSGRFDPNPNGETYLPFENEPVVSMWEITLPDSLEFDPATISDLVFNIRYTAQPDNDSGVGEPTTTPPAPGSFGVSLRQDNYDGWLQLHRDLEADPATPGAWDAYFTDAVVTAATPYVYSSWAVGLIAFYALCSTSEGLVAHQISDPTEIQVVLGKLKHTKDGVDDDVLDIVQVRAAIEP